jgi:hypothetical protein
MGAIQTQPLRFDDFSGGITDQYLPSEQNKYLRAENLLITADKQLLQRAGSRPYNGDDSRVAGAERVSSLSFLGVQLLATHDAKISYPHPSTGVWTALTGPTGNSALGAGAATDLVSTAEWRNHRLFTTQATTGKPQKVYIAQGDTTPSVRTLGLPDLPASANYVSATLLSDCVTLANSLRTQMLAHMNDQGSGVGVSLHAALDAARATLNGSTPASDLGTLITLCAALRTAFISHTAELAAGVARSIHFAPTFLILTETDSGVDDTDPTATVTPVVEGQTITNAPVALHPGLSAATPTAVEEAATFLNDLRQKYYWHTWAPFLHDPVANTVTLLNKYQPAAKVTEPSETVVVTPRWDQYINLIDEVSDFFFDHTSGADGSVHADTDTRFDGSPAKQSAFTPTDFDSWVVKLVHLRAAYWTHWLDANNPSYYLAGAITNGSAIYSAVKIGFDSFDGSGGATFDGSGTFRYASGWTDDWEFTLGINVGKPSLLRDGDSTVSANAISSGSITASVNAVATSSYVRRILTNSRYHYQSDAARTSTKLSLLSDGSVLSFAKHGATLAEWVEMFNELVDCLNEHTLTPSRDATHVETWTYPPDGWGLQFVPDTRPNTMPYIESAQYLYAFCYLREYTVNDGVVYQDRGPVTQIGPIEVIPPHPTRHYRVGLNGTVIDSLGSGTPVQASTWADISGASLSNIPTLVNASTDNYDTANLKLEIYRTTSNGSAFFLHSTITNGTTTLDDELHDTDVTGADTPLATREPLYTTGGVVENDPPPTCKYLHVLGNFTYFGAIVEDGESFPRRIRQSIADDPDAAPGSFFVDLDDDLMGISSTKGRVVALCATSLYRLEGSFDELGDGSIDRDQITDAVGCISPNGIVQTEFGILFPGQDGFYLTDGFQAKKISDFDLRYKKYTETAAQRRRISGTYDQKNRRIWWTMQATSAGAECDSIFVLDLNYPLSPASAFTTVAGGTTFKPTALLFDNGVLYRGDPDGYILKHDDTYKTDSVVDTGTLPSAWLTERVNFDFISGATDFGTTQVKKWVTRLNVLARKYGDLDVGIFSINDHKTSSALKGIAYVHTDVWGASDFTYGVNELAFIGANVGVIDEWRRFPSGSLRCEYKQIRLTNSGYGAGLATDQRFHLINYTLQVGFLGQSQSDWGAEA